MGHRKVEVQKKIKSLLRLRPSHTSLGLISLTFPCSSLWSSVVNRSLSPPVTLPSSFIPLILLSSLLFSLVLCRSSVVFQFLFVLFSKSSLSSLLSYPSPACFCLCLFLSPIYLSPLFGFLSSSVALLLLSNLFIILPKSSVFLRYLFLFVPLPFSYFPVSLLPSSILPLSLYLPPLFPPHKHTNTS